MEATHGFTAGDRLALLLPNNPEYIELAYACSWLGVIAVPIITRLSQLEIDRIIADANPPGLVRHSSWPTPTAGTSFVCFFFHWVVLFALVATHVVLHRVSIRTLDELPFEELCRGMADGAPATATPVITIGYAIVHRDYLTETRQHRARAASRWCKNAADCGRGAHRMALIHAHFAGRG